MTSYKLLAEKLIFGGRLLLLPMYLGLTVALAVYAVRYVIDIYHLLVNFMSYDDTQILIAVLQLIDIIMVCHLIVMAKMGGYVHFIGNSEEREGESTASHLKWLDHVDPGVLKVKLSMAIVGVSSIHLLEAFVNAHNESWEYLIKLIVIHLIFVVSSIAVAWVNRHAFHNQH